MSQPGLRASAVLLTDPLADVPAFVRAHMRPDVTPPPAPGTADANAAVRRVADRLAAEEAEPKHGGNTHRRDGSPRRSPRPKTLEVPHA